MGNATVRLKAPKLVQVMTSIVAWSSVLIDPTGQCTAHPIMPPLPRRRDDRQPTRACPPKPDPRP